MIIFSGMKEYKPYNPDQPYLLPPSMRDWLPERHLALFVLDVARTLDLSPIYAVYEQGDGRGQPPYHPLMMVTLLLYAYCTGKPSSRKIETATWEDVAYRVIAGDQHPDHDSIAAFRQRHLAALAGLFVQVLRLCERAGLVKLGHVALDGTKVKANASKHKAMSYGRMAEAEQRLEEEVRKLLEEAAQVDAEEDAKYGQGKRGDELPEELRRRESRLKKIREAKAALEAEARAKAEAAAAEARGKLAERERQETETGKKVGGRKPTVPHPEQAQPEPKAQKNFTDPESRIMKDGATKEFIQGYNAQAAVDEESQVIVAAAVTLETNDKKQLAPMVEKVEENTGRKPEKLSADAGYFSEDNVTAEQVADVDLYVPPDRQKHGEEPQPKADAASAKTAAGRMRQKLKTPEGHAVYKMRKAIVEPVFGQIKEVRGFRRFSFRGLKKVAGEWDLICLTHNLLKVFRSGWRQLAAVAA
jgi:transposase